MLYYNSAYTCHVVPFSEHNFACLPSALSVLPALVLLVPLLQRLMPSEWMSQFDDLDGVMTKHLWCCRLG